MLYNNITEKTLVLQGVNVINIEKGEKTLTIYIEMKRKAHNCICCGTRLPD